MNSTNPQIQPSTSESNINMPNCTNPLEALFFAFFGENGRQFFDDYNRGYLNRDYTNNYHDKTNISNASKSICEIKRHLALLKQSMNEASEIDSAEINSLVDEIKGKVNSLEAVMKRKDFDLFAKEFDFLLMQVQWNTLRPQSDKTSELEYLFSNEDNIYSIQNLLFDNDYDYEADCHIEYVRNNANRIICVLSTQLDCYLNKLHLGLIPMSNLFDIIQTIPCLIKKVLYYLEYTPSPKNCLPEETLTKLMQHLLPLKMLVVYTKFNRKPNQKSNSNVDLFDFDLDIFWSPINWFVNPTALLSSCLKLIHQLAVDAEANCSHVNKYLSLIDPENQEFNKESFKTLAMETICLDFGLMVKRFKESRIELDDAHLDSILLSIHSLSEHDPDFKSLKSTDADIALRNLMDHITIQFGDAIWDHFGLVVRAIESNNPNGKFGYPKKSWLMDYLKLMGLERMHNDRATPKIIQSSRSFEMANLLESENPVDEFDIDKHLIRFDENSLSSITISSDDSSEEANLPPGTLSPPIFEPQPDEPQTNAEDLLKLIQRLKEDWNKTQAVFEKLTNLMISNKDD